MSSIVFINERAKISAYWKKLGDQLVRAFVRQRFADDWQRFSDFFMMPSLRSLPDGVDEFDALYIDLGGEA